MIPYPNISPDLIRIGRFRVRWYGVMYLLGFLVGRQILRRLSKRNFLRLPADNVDDYLVWIFIGMLIGARAVYMLVYYEPAPGEAWHWYTPFAVWQGGLAFHGGAIGMFTALWLFGRFYKVRFWNLTDSLALAAPVGIALGRIGNFINAELYGRPTDVPWAMRFPVRDFSGKVFAYTEPRHPSQLYESFGEGLMTLLIVWLYKRRARYQGTITAVGICWYGFARFLIEFFREKDEQMRYYFGWMTMGQILSGIMFIIGVIIYVVCVKRAVPVDAPATPQEPPKDTKEEAPAQ